MSRSFKEMFENLDPKEKVMFILKPSSLKSLSEAEAKALYSFKNPEDSQKTNQILNKYFIVQEMAEYNKHFMVEYYLRFKFYSKELIHTHYVMKSIFTYTEIKNQFEKYRPENNDFKNNVRNALNSLFDETGHWTDDSDALQEKLDYIKFLMKKLHQLACVCLLILQTLQKISKETDVSPIVNSEELKYFEIYFENIKSSCNLCNRKIKDLSQYYKFNKLEDYLIGEITVSQKDYNELIAGLGVKDIFN